MFALGQKMVAPGLNFGGTGEEFFECLNWFKEANCGLETGPSR